MTIASALRPFPREKSFASSAGPLALPVALLTTQVDPTATQPPILKNQVLWQDHMVSATTPTVSPPTRGVLSPGATVQLLALPSNRPDYPLYLPTRMARSSWQAPQPLVQLAAKAATPRGGNLERQAYEPCNAYLVDLTPDEEEGAVMEAQEEDTLKDLELFF